MMDGNLAASDRQTYMTEEQMGALGDMLMEKETSELIRYAAVEIMGYTLTNLWVRKPEILNAYKCKREPDFLIELNDWHPDTDSNQLDLIEDVLLGMEITIDENKVPYRRTIVIMPYPDETNVDWKPSWSVMLSCESKADWNLTRLKAYVSAHRKIKND